ncbi:MAG TPA: hypothetical protein VJB14_08205 [Planctomycetota bacterium]|nr:hypothetical protein [Planctomycetota bacterium]
MEESDRSKRAFLFILVPMVTTFALQRLVLHHSSPDTHVFIAGVLVHHLFSGVLILIPTAFLLAMGIRTPWRRDLARAVLGFSSAMVLDEVIYLICTDGSGVAYRGSLSLGGAAVLVSLAVAFLVAAHGWARRIPAAVHPGLEEVRAKGDPSIAPRPPELGRYGKGRP